MDCFSGCLMSSAGIQKLFCGIYSVFKCSFDEFVREKVVSPSYSSTVLATLPHSAISGLKFVTLLSAVFVLFGDLLSISFVLVVTVM